MFNGLSNDEKTPDFAPDSVITIEGDSFVYRGPTASHAFGRFSGTLMAAAPREDLGRVDLCFIHASGRKVLLVLPLDGGPALRLLLALSSQRVFAGRRLDIDATPMPAKGGGTKTAVTVHDGERELPWSVPVGALPRTKDGVRPLVLRLLGDVLRRLGDETPEEERSKAPRLAPDIDDVPEGL